jgi:AAA family ATP:ADP antiporter
MCMFAMVVAMFFYMERFRVVIDPKTKSSEKEKSDKEGGIMEGFTLFYKHDYVKGIFAVSSLFMIQVTVFDYMMKVLAKSEFEAKHPNDKEAALIEFASFMGFFGQV